MNGEPELISLCLSPGKEKKRGSVSEKTHIDAHETRWVKYRGCKKRKEEGGDEGKDVLGRLELDVGLPSSSIE